MSYCRSPVYIISTCCGDLECFDADIGHWHHDGKILHLDPGNNIEKAVLEHMRWHHDKFEAEGDHTRASLLWYQMKDLVLEPQYKKWWHYLSPWHLLWWRRFIKFLDWVEPEEEK